MSKKATNRPAMESLDRIVPLSNYEQSMKELLQDVFSKGVEKEELCDTIRKVVISNLSTCPDFQGNTEMHYRIREALEHRSLLVPSVNEHPTAGSRVGPRIIAAIWGRAEDVEKCDSLLSDWDYSMEQKLAVNR